MVKDSFLVQLSSRHSIKSSGTLEFLYFGSKLIIGIRNSRSMSHRHLAKHRTSKCLLSSRILIRRREIKQPPDDFEL